MHLFLLSLFLSTSTSQTCEVANCESCSIRSASVCINCNKGFIRDEFEGCVADVVSTDYRIENCEVYLESSKNCKACQAGYVLLNDRCEPECDDRCICFSPSLCTGKASFKQEVGERGGGRGGHNGHDGHDHEEDEFESSESSTGFYCNYGCSVCDASGYCTNCDSGYSNVDGVCAKGCGEGCASCILDLCSTCEDGYFLINDQCQSCMDHCEMCSNEFSCLQCSSEYNYKDDKCKKNSEKEQEMVVMIAVPISCGVGFVAIIGIVCCCLRRKLRKSLNFECGKLDVTPDFNIKSPPSPLLVENPSVYPNLPEIPANLVNRVQEGPSAPSLASSSTAVLISPHNFLNVVPIVHLDNSLKFMGQDNCVICKENFSKEVETRSLPCLHAFHGKCIYDTMAIGNQKSCPICRREYM